MTKTVNTLVWDDFKNLWQNGTNPFTGVDDVNLQESFKEVLKHAWREEEVENLGTFKEVDGWSLGDGHEMGRVVRHLETDTLFLLSGTYSSWDSSEWHSLSMVEPYEKTVTRYRTVEGSEIDFYDEY